MKFNSFNSFFVVVVDLILVIMTTIFTTKLIILNKFKAADELMFFKFKPVYIFTLHGFISQCL